MKLAEIIESRDEALLIRLKNKLKKKRFNPKPSKTPTWGTWDPFGGMTGYPSQNTAVSGGGGSGY